MSKSDKVILKDSIFRIGKVISVDGRDVKISVDKQKNSSHLLYNGELLKNVSVGGYVKIIKGFTAIIGKVESEYVKEDKNVSEKYGPAEAKINRVLLVKLLGFLEGSTFERGIKELPLIENECFLLDNKEISKVHDFIKKGDKPIRLGVLAESDGQGIAVGVNSLFASHFGIFGNTGSGKSYTLARIYRVLFKSFEFNQGFKDNAKFLLFDFNGEYSSETSIIPDKHVYNLSTRTSNGQDKLRLSENDLLNVELISIMASATEKTQRPFISRSLRFYSRITGGENPVEHFRNVLRNRIRDILQMADKTAAFQLLDYLKAILPESIGEDFTENDLLDDLDFHNQSKEFTHDGVFLRTNPDQIENTKIYRHVLRYDFDSDFISKLIHFLYLQLIKDVLTNRAQNEHIFPAINKLKSFQKNMGKVIEVRPESDDDFWSGKCFAVINLNDTNLDVKKLIPLLVSYKLYNDHKSIQSEDSSKSLNIIVDEAHNILSYSSQRESESWKDYRLETFEEIVKEGRKFGVFLTIASQRPSDISTTIISQLHNYFLHRLINNNDILAIEKTVSYLDKVSFDSLPLLPTGVCIVAGLLAQVPVIVKIDEIENEFEPNNKTINLVENWQ